MPTLAAESRIFSATAPLAMLKTKSAICQRIERGPPDGGPQSGGLWTLVSLLRAVVVSSRVGLRSVTGRGGVGIAFFDAGRIGREDVLDRGSSERMDREVQRT